MFYIYNLCCALEFSQEISKVGTQTIIGSQINFKYKDLIGKVPIFAKTDIGFKNLTKLSSKSFLDIKENEDPHCDIINLFENKEDLIILSGGIDSLLANLIKNNRQKEVQNLIEEFKKNFPDLFYLEIQRHNDTGEKNLEEILLGYSGKFKLPIIASREIFYLKKDMHEAHDALICIGEKTYVDEKNRKKYSNEHYLKNTKEMSEIYKDLPEALENNYNFPFRFSFKPNKSDPVLPSIKISLNHDESEELLLQSKNGLNNRLKNYIFKKNKTQTNSKLEEIYNKRLMHEIKIINEMKYAGYFLIVSDYIKWAKQNSIPVGPGRGSVQGSLVAYCLDITDLDPIEFDLIFERFLNPDRISMPDFDIDFCEEKRDMVFKYLRSKYKNGVAHIITFGKLKARMALRDIGRVIGLPYGHVDKI